MTKYIRIKSPLHKQSEKNLHVLLNETCQNSQPYCIFIQNDNTYRTILIKNRCLSPHFHHSKDRNRVALYSIGTIYNTYISFLVLWYIVSGLQRADSKNSNQKLNHKTKKLFVIKRTVLHAQDSKCQNLTNHYLFCYQ